MGAGRFSESSVVLFAANDFSRQRFEFDLATEFILKRDVQREFTLRITMYEPERKRAEQVIHTSAHVPEVVRLCNPTLFVLVNLLVY
jgi:hypothetical protein